MKRLFIVAVCIVLAGCASKLPPSTSVEAKTAIKGTQVVEGLRAAIPEIKMQVCQASKPAPCINPADAERIFKLMEQAAGYAEELSKGLAVVDGAQSPTERETALVAARRYVKLLSDTISMVQIQPGDAEARQAVVKILAGVMSVLLVIG